eukprot:Gb_20460 [translate_table: standard]
MQQFMKRMEGRGRHALHGILDALEFFLYSLDRSLQACDTSLNRASHFSGHEIGLPLSNVGGQMLHPLPFLKIALLRFVLYGVGINFMNAPDGVLPVACT